MNREIKYLAFVRMGATQFYAGTYKVRAIDFLERTVTVERASAFAVSVFSFEDIELREYTGLKDKNGKEIYEGDIVKYKERSYGGFYDEDVIVIGEVMFNYSRWRVERRVATPANRMTPEFEFQYNAKYTEVIGNIYENPELLKGD